MSTADRTSTPDEVTTPDRVRPAARVNMPDQWWGYSKEHGWVVLDRTLSCNRPGVRRSLVFLRCRDEKIVNVKFESWSLPGYQLAENYLRNLSGERAQDARGELDAIKVRWPQLQLELKRQIQEAAERDAARLRDIERIGAGAGRS